MAVSTLHYLFDPLCGWCYGAAPLLQAAAKRFPIELHAGGLFSGAQRQRLGEPLRRHILAHDRRIAEMSGQPFGSAYREGLLNDPLAWLDSDPPTAAILAAEALAGAGLDMLHSLQRAHYLEGRRVAEPGLAVELAEQLGLSASAFAAELAHLGGPVLAEHQVASRRLLARLGASGFPTLAVECEGHWQVLDIGQYLGRTATFVEALAAARQAVVPHSQVQ